LSLKSKSADLSPGLLDISFFMSLGLDLLLVHGHLVVPTGGFLDLLLVHGHTVVPTGILMNHWLWISRVHPVEWLSNDDGMVMVMDASAKLSSG